MGTSKKLTIAIPTYNRSAFLKQSLERISKQILNHENDIELIVSDNCSTDDTKEVVAEFIQNGMPIIYNRNIINKGMDGNFVYCFQSASAKYVWVLGDDDYLTEGTISKLLNIIDTGEYGLIHLKNTLQHSEKDKFESRVSCNEIEFIGEISFMITFISANIVQTKYVEKINFNKYFGTYFTLIPLYLTAAIEEKKNLMVYSKTMDIAADGLTNGGYNIFEVFVTNYLKILKEYIPNLGFIWYEIEKYKLCRKFLYGWMKRLLVNRNHGLNFKTNHWFKILFKKYWYEPYFYPMLLLFYINKFKILYAK